MEEMIDRIQAGVDEPLDVSALVAEIERINASVGTVPAVEPAATPLPYAFHDHAGEWYQDVSPETNAVPACEEQAEARERALAEYEASLRERCLPGPPVSSAHGDGVASLIESIATGRRQVHILNLPNRGAVPNLPAHAVLEMEAVTDSCGARPIYTGEAPLALKGLLEKRIAWQELVVDAAATGDRNAALQALLTDEMSIRPELAEQMLDELLAASRDLLPQFDPSPSRAGSAVKV
jgi:alpha-galactosidase/6-phospho-beta-glucosidase family protein